MIEEIVLSYLSSALEEPVYMEEPEKKPERYVVVEKTGSSCENYIKSATFAFKSHAESLYEAAKLNERVKEAMDAIIASDAVCRSQLNGDYNFTNTQTKKYRYQAVYDLMHY